MRTRKQGAPDDSPPAELVTHPPCVIVGCKTNAPAGSHRCKGCHGIVHATCMWEINQHEGMNGGDWCGPGFCKQQTPATASRDTASPRAAEAVAAMPAAGASARQPAAFQTRSTRSTRSTMSAATKDSASVQGAGAAAVGECAGGADCVQGPSVSLQSRTQCCGQPCHMLCASLCQRCAGLKPAAQAPLGDTENAIPTRSTVSGPNDVGVATTTAAALTPNGEPTRRDAHDMPDFAGSSMLSGKASEEQSAQPPSGNTEDMQAESGGSAGSTAADPDVEFDYGGGEDDNPDLSLGATGGQSLGSLLNNTPAMLHQDSAVGDVDADDGDDVQVEKVVQSGSPLVYGLQHGPPAPNLYPAMNAATALPAFHATQARVPPSVREKPRTPPTQQPPPPAAGQPPTVQNNNPDNHARLPPASSLATPASNHTPQQTPSPAVGGGAVGAVGGGNHARLPPDSSLATPASKHTPQQTPSPAVGGGGGGGGGTPAGGGSLRAGAAVAAPAAFAVGGGNHARLPPASSLATPASKYTPQQTPSPAVGGGGTPAGGGSLRDGAAVAAPAALAVGSGGGTAAGGGSPRAAHTSSAAAVAKTSTLHNPYQQSATLQNPYQQSANRLQKQKAASGTGGAAVRRGSTSAAARTTNLNLRPARGPTASASAPVSTVVATVDKAGLHKHVEASIGQCAAKYFGSAAFSKELVKAFGTRDWSKEVQAATGKMFDKPSKKYQEEVRKVAEQGTSMAMGKATAPAIAKLDKSVAATGNKLEAHAKQTKQTATALKEAATSINQAVGKTERLMKKAEIQSQGAAAMDISPMLRKLSLDLRAQQREDLEYGLGQLTKMLFDQRDGGLGNSISKASAKAVSSQISGLGDDVARKVASTSRDESPDVDATAAAVERLSSTILRNMTGNEANRESVHASTRKKRHEPFSPLMRDRDDVKHTRAPSSGAAAASSRVTPVVDSRAYGDGVSVETRDGTGGWTWAPRPARNTTPGFIFQSTNTTANIDVTQQPREQQEQVFVRGVQMQTPQPNPPPQQQQGVFVRGAPQHQQQQPPPPQQQQQQPPPPQQQEQQQQQGMFVPVTQTADAQGSTGFFTPAPNGAGRPTYFTGGQGR